MDRINYKETIDVISKVKNGVVLQEKEEEYVKLLLKSNRLYTDYFELTSLNGLNMMDKEFIKYFNTKLSAVLAMLNNETFSDEDVSVYIEDLKKIYYYERKFNLNNIVKIEDFTFKKGDWFDTVEGELVYNNYLVIHSRMGFIDVIKVITKDGNYPENLNIENIQLSIGWKPDYYEKINSLFSEQEEIDTYYEAVSDVKKLSAERYSEIYESNKLIFEKSIYRYNTTTYILDESSSEKNKVFKLKQNEELEIDFSNRENMNNNFIVLIGENGVGKSSLLKSIYIENNTNDECVVLKDKMYYSKQLYFSFGLFDKLHGIPSFSSFHIRDYLSEKQFYKIFERGMICFSQRRQNELFEIINDFFTEENTIVGKFLDNLELFFNGHSSYNDLYSSFINLSTGQKYIIYFFANLVSSITQDSLIYIDEIENSQHPQFVLKIMTHLNSLLNKYNSKAIIATHSHLIIQAVPRYAVINLYRDIEQESNSGIILYKKVDSQTFGRDFNVLMQRIYALKASDYLYLDVLKNYIIENPRKELDFLYEGRGFDSKLIKSTIDQIKESYE